MSHMICLYKLTNGQLAPIEMEKVQRAFSDLTSEDWSDYQGGNISFNLPSLKPIQKPQPKASFLSRVFKKTNNEITEQNEQEIDADEHSIAFNRPQEGFETAMFELMSNLKLVAIRDESFTESPEAIISTKKLSSADIPAEIDSMPTQDMELLFVQNANELLEALYS